MTIIRWLGVVPGGLLAAGLGYLLAVVSLGLGHGFETILQFLNASDMAGMWVTGTYSLVSVRGIQGAASTWAVSRIAPRGARSVAWMWVALLCLFPLLLVWWAISADVTLTFGVWYRFGLETVALLGGSMVAIMALPPSWVEQPRADANDPTGNNIGAEPHHV